ncbi:unnamed protein product [Rangifer tarandus platyrhynchus]|uniref:Uncharacterized protein n=1 Tax=Rangifer tarandus platyrhynchus TaxID=3082113 RepID=A0AC59ZZN4_RANTA
MWTLILIVRVIHNFTRKCCIIVVIANILLATSNGNEFKTSALKKLNDSFLSPFRFAKIKVPVSTFLCCIRFSHFLSLLSHHFYVSYHYHFHHIFFSCLSYFNLFSVSLEYECVIHFK